MKTEEQLEMIKRIPIDKLMLETGILLSFFKRKTDNLETDAPWCSLTGGHASKHHLANLSPALKSLYFPQATQPEKWIEGKPVKGRNEPCAIGGVAFVVAQ